MKASNITISCALVSGKVDNPFHRRQSYSERLTLALTVVLS